MARSWLVLLAALSGCSSAEWAPPDCQAQGQGQTEEPLVNATAAETYLGLAASHLRAIVQITNGPEPEAPLCSGAFVAPDWVVTAAHCFAIDSPYVVVRDQGEDAKVAVVERIAHPTLDLLLLKLEMPDGGFGLEPLRSIGPDDRLVSVGDALELAGHGVTETGGTRELRFLVEEVVAVEDESIIVSGFGTNGACQGDSGGPLLLRDGTGEVIVAGVLSTGSASCLDRDRYVRLDVTSEWIDEVTGGYASNFDECGGIDEEGRCLYGTALFCNGGKLVAETCSADTHCGYSDRDGGFRCVSPADDPCDGIDQLGSCRDGSALRCDRGVLERRRCECGLTCRIDGKTGQPYCAE